MEINRLSEIGSSTFTAHNILLDDGSQTLASAGYFMSQHPTFLAASRTLRLAFPGGLKGVRIADLGCLEGGYSVEFARLGMDVVGVEARKSNFQNCMMVKSKVNLGNLCFVRDDAWNLENYGRFDAIFCAGLLYHLDRPVAFIDLLGDLCKKVLILGTHFAPEEQSSVFSLSDLTENEGAQGRWYEEFPSDFKSDKEQNKWASWSNDKSFWLRKEYIIQTMREAGFPVVFEQFDGLGSNIAGEMLLGAYRTMHRSTFVGVKI